MGKFFNKLKERGKKIDNSLERPINYQRMNNSKFRNPHNKNMPNTKEEIEENKNYDLDFYNDFDEVGIQPAQKPESFHHFILENQYKDLERSIRGLKDVWDKENQKWRTKRKEIHCFTDEEAEDILRTAQSHLATDIKLGRIRQDQFGDYMDAIYKEISFLFESIAEYRYGRYNHFDKNTGNLIKVNYESQYAMKLQNQKIFLELWTRIQMNYSRAIDANENKATHQGVRGQESLQSGERDYSNRMGGYN